MPERFSRKPWKWLLAVFAAILVLFIGILAAASWTHDQVHAARTALQQYGDDLVAGKYGEAYALRDPELQRAWSESEFEKAHELAESRNGKLQKVVLEPTEKVGDRKGMIVVINSQLIYEHAQNRYAVTMKKEENRWLVHDARYTGK